MAVTIVLDAQRLLPRCPIWALWLLMPLLLVFSRGFRCVALYRLARTCLLNDSPLEARFFTALNEELHGVGLHSAANLGPGLAILGGFGVVVGPNVIAGRGLTLHMGSGMAAVGGRSPSLGDDVTLYHSAQIAGSCHIGNGAVILPKASVSFDVPAQSIAGDPELASAWARSA